jgi:hypothetical protein
MWIVKQHALQEEREMKLRHGDKAEILSHRNPTKPLVANLSGSLREGAESKAWPQPADAKKQQ